MKQQYDFELIFSLLDEMEACALRVRALRIKWDELLEAK